MALSISFLSYYSGVSFRGAETYVHELANALTIKGVNVTVYQSGNRQMGSLYQTRIVPKSLSDFNFYALRSVKSEITIPINGRLQSALARIYCRRVIISGQSGLGADDRFNLYTCPSAFVALTPPQQSWAKKIAPWVNTQMIPNGVNLQYFNTRIKPLSKPLPGPIILCVSALEPIKRLHLLIQAVAHTPASLWVVGRGSQRPQLEQLGQKLLPGRMLISAFPYKQMPQIYRTADLFAFTTSPWESFGLVLLEAMACGLPIVVSDDPIRRYIVGSAGIYSQPESPLVFASALNQALSRTWGHRPHDQAKLFAWPIIADRYISLFNSL